MFRHLKLSMKLTLGFTLVLLLTTVVAVVGIVYLNQIADGTQRMINHPYTVHTEILRAQRNIIAIGREMKDVVINTDRLALENNIKTIDELEKVALEAFDLLYERFLGERAMIERAHQAVIDWKPIRDEAINLQLAGRQADANRVITDKGAPQIQLIEERIQAVVDFARNTTENFRLSAIQDAKTARNILLMTLAVVYLIAIIAGATITRGITKPVTSLLSFSQAIASGDLSVADVDYESKDEIGVLANALNGMRESLQNMVATVNESVNVVNDSANQMSSAAQETSASVEELASTANQFASAVDGLSNNVQHMSDSADKTNDLSRDGSIEIERTVATMSEINELVTALAVDMRDLGRQSEEIGQIVTLITGIADQTNLLALNAAIEAARAGEQGRGFAVVAEEVRKLAEQSSSAAGEITQLIYQIRDSAQNSVKRTDLGATKVQEGMDVVNKSGRMFGDIAAIIHQLAQEINEIASATEELAAGAEEMGATTEEQSATTEQMAASAVEVSQAAARVHTEMGWFKL